MSTIRFERSAAIGSIVLANPPFNRIDLRYGSSLREAVHAASESDIRVLMVRAEGPNFSLGGEVREWPGKDINWFRTFVADVNASYRAIETLRVPTVAVVRGLAFGGGFELALACDFVVAAENAVFCCVEVTTGMLPIAVALQRLAERAEHARASRISMLGEPILGKQAGELGIATHVVPEAKLDAEANTLANRLASGPTRSYPSATTLLKSWAGGVITPPNPMKPHVTMELFNTPDRQPSFINTPKAPHAKIPPPEMTFEGK